MELDVLRGMSMLWEDFLHLPRAAHFVLISAYSGLLGSFINVCIWRIPRGESIIYPRSRCVHCKHVLMPPDLVPILSYLAMRGRCRHCSQPVSFRYVVVEFIVVGLWVSAFALLGLSLRFVALGTLLSAAFTGAGILWMKRQLALEAKPHPEPASTEETAAAPPDSPKNDPRAGFTFITVMLAALIMGICIGPFMQMARTGFLGSAKNQEYIRAYALASEKIEELRSIPARKLKGDRQVYVETDRITDNIFSDEFFGDFQKMREDRDYFYLKFTDVYTADSKLPDNVRAKFERAFEKYHGFKYRPYPPGYEVFRRVTRVQELPEETADSGRGLVRKVTVTVVIDSPSIKGRKIEMEVLLSDH